LIHFKYDFDTSGTAPEASLYFTQSGKEDKATKLDLQDFCYRLRLRKPFEPQRHGGTKFHKDFVL
jgi:hypothetical protein